MKKGIYAVFDQASKLFSNPWLAVRREQAIRDFTYAANDPETEICKYSNDYALVCLGEFDDETGLYTTHQPEFLLSAFTVKEGVIQTPAEV